MIQNEPAGPTQLDDLLLILSEARNYLDEVVGTTANKKDTPQPGPGRLQVKLQQAHELAGDIRDMAMCVGTLI